MIKETLLNFVDLAGSEKVSNNMKSFTGDESKLAISQLQDGSKRQQELTSQKSLVKEGKHINKSLFYLTQVISRKARGHSEKYIQY